MKNYRVEVVCVGTELLSGKVNTHVAYIGTRLLEAGLSIAVEHTVGDNKAEMKNVFSSAWRKSDIVICAGGLGPTFDDETREVWSNVLGRPLLKDPVLVADIKTKFDQRGLVMPPANIRQAFVLKGAQVLNNRFGTAPGQMIQIGPKILFLLPGPFRELSPMMREVVVPRLRQMNGELFLEHKTFFIFGISESEIDRRIRPIVDRSKTLKKCSVVFGILASQGLVSVKFLVQGRDQRQVLFIKDKLTKSIRAILAKDKFGEDQDTLVSVVTTLLRERHQTLAVAESCTGGLLSEMITSEPGASDIFVEGIVSYANSSKVDQLKVPEAKLKQEGAVSVSVAKAMAEGARRRAHSSYGISITGIAGPSAAGTNKPVGLVYIGCSSIKKTQVFKFQFVGDRAQIRLRASLTALNILRKAISH